METLLRLKYCEYLSKGLLRRVYQYELINTEASFASALDILVSKIRETMF